MGADPLQLSERRRHESISGACIAVEIWADGHKEADIDRWMENGMTADLTLEQAKKLHEMLGEAISKAEKVVE